MRMAPPDCWPNDISVLLTSVWDWSPETWGTVGWTGDKGKTRRDNLLHELTDPFVMVAYATDDAPSPMRGRLVGFMLVSHETGDRDEFTDPAERVYEPLKWRHSLRGLRAFSYLPEYRPHFSEFDPGAHKKALAISGWGMVYTDAPRIEVLRTLPWAEVSIYQGRRGGDLSRTRSAVSEGQVRAGPANMGGYSVPETDPGLLRELYVLRLDGDVTAYIGRAAAGRAIYKVGLSVSPEMRRVSLQKALPEGAFVWKTERTNTICKLPRCASFDAAVAGEDAMKAILARDGDWRGGEFYLASPEVMDRAWAAGQEAVKAFAARVNP